MPRIAFIGNLFHQKTSSSYFFIELLQKRYEIDFYWGLPRNQLKEVDFATLRSIKYDSIICWQVMPDAAILLEANCRNIIMIPMYDNAYDIPDSRWRLYSGFKFLNFSLTLHRKLQQLGMRTGYFQYFPAEKECKFFKDGRRGFFWQRKADITWNEVRQLIHNIQFENFHIHRAVDPDIEFTPPSPEDIKKYNITFSDWFDTKQDYIEKVRVCDIYFAPRLYEGIGLSFLEAMAMGKCVIAPDCPTMNEYIVTGYNGVLYDVHSIKSLDLSNLGSIRKNAIQSVEVGHKKWMADEEKLIKFIEETSTKKNWLLKKISMLVKRH